MNLKSVMVGMKMYLTKGWKSMGKCLLTNCVPVAVAAGYKDSVDALLTSQGIKTSSHLSSLTSAESVPDVRPPRPTIPEVFEAGSVAEVFDAAERVFEDFPHPGEVYYFFSL